MVILPIIFSVLFACIFDVTFRMNIYNCEKRSLLSIQINFGDIGILILHMLGETIGITEDDYSCCSLN